MTHDDELGIPRVRLGPIQWLSNSIRISIEKSISKYKEREWKIKIEKDLSEFACHHCAIVSDGSFAIFSKYSEAAEANRQFEIELSDLQTLSKRAGIPIPRPLDIVQAENGWLLIMEALEAVKRGPRQWRQIGATLARIHRVKGNGCCFETNGFNGPLYQDNTPIQNLAAFYRERRLLPRLRVAIDSGNITSAAIS